MASVQKLPSGTSRLFLPELDKPVVSPITSLICSSTSAKYPSTISCTCVSTSVNESTGSISQLTYLTSLLSLSMSSVKFPIQLRCEPVRSEERRVGKECRCEGCSVHVENRKVVLG